MTPELLLDSITIDWLFAFTPYISGFLIILFIIFGFIFNYHWSQYTIGFVPLTMFRILYLVVGGIIIITMLGAQALL